MTRGGLFRGILEGAHYGRPHRKDWPAVAARLANRGRRGIGNFVALGMNLMLFDLLFVDGLECAEAHVQRDGNRFDASLAQSFENGGRKMQAGCRSGNGSRMLGEDRLVTFAVGRLILARNVWRQRNVAEAFNRLRDISLRRQTDSPHPVVAAADHFRGKLPVSKFDALSHTDLSTRTDQGFPLLCSDLLRQKDFNWGGQEFTRCAAMVARLFGAHSFPAAQ